MSRPCAYCYEYLDTAIIDTVVDERRYQFCCITCMCMLKYEKGARENFGFNHEIYKRTLNELYPGVARRRAIRRRQRQQAGTDAQENAHEQDKDQNCINTFHQEEPDFFALG